ncbi:MAG TPA: hypothetical protein VFV20_07590 [Candidatus Limnocylindria bacterium]|nr:hypothetical protein [Candidatus Limnocylindria bacterium]
MSDDRGQAAILAVCLIAIAAAVMGGLRVAQTALLARAVERRAGEAAVEAATAVVADAYAAEVRARRSPSGASRDVASVVGDAITREAARAGASDMSVRNGGESVSDVAVACDAGAVTVTIELRGTLYRASFEAPECSRR